MAVTTLFFIIIAALLAGGFLERRRRQDGASPTATGISKSRALPNVVPHPAVDWESRGPPKFRPFKPTYHITMALQSTLPEDLIVLDGDYKDKIETRRRVLATNPDCTMGVLQSDNGTGPEPSAKAALDELYCYLMDSYLPGRFPTVFSKVRAGQGKAAMLYNRVTNSTFPCTPPLDPLEATRILGETVEDDLFLLREEDVTSTTDDGPAYPATSHRMVAFVCCFPSGFDPSSKLGLLLRDIHKPVPAYDKIGPSMERFFSRLEVGKNRKRLNWSVQTHTDLFAPVGNHVHKDDAFEMDAVVDIENARLRVECQTLSRLPHTDTVLFSFKTYLFAIKDIKAEGHGADLADAIDGLKAGNAPGMWTYKGGVRWGKSVCEYLRA